MFKIFTLNHVLISAIGFSILVLTSCQKEVPPELRDNPAPQTQEKPQTREMEMPHDSIHNRVRENNVRGDENNDNSEGDPKAVELMKEADDADAKYQKTKSEADKKLCIQKQLEAANYLMYDAKLPPKKKYRPALSRFRRVLQLDPSNTQAKQNKEKIEEIYESMGMPIPNS